MNAGCKKILSEEIFTGTYSRTPRCIIGVFKRPRLTNYKSFNLTIMSKDTIVTLATSGTGKEYCTISTDSHLPGIKSELVIPISHSVAEKDYKMVSGEPLPDNANTKALMAAYGKKFTVPNWNN